MNKKLVVVLMALAATAQAGTISRTYTYTDGNTMSANENNTNENTLYNEINGALDSANIENGTLLNEDMADTQLVVTKFASNVQSTFTYVNLLGAYRRPTLVFVSVTTVDVEANTGTSNQTCIFFPDERRCVTENTASTSVNRRFIITEAAAYTGTKNSGLAAGEAEADNTYYALYAVKVQDNATDFVIAGSTNQPTLANYATLNTRFGTNGWVYLGMIRNGDQSAAASSILTFSQSGNFTQYFNTATGANTGRGIRLAHTAGATSLSLSFSIGTTGATVPSTAINNMFMQASLNPSTSINMQVFDQNTSGFQLVNAATGGVGATLPFIYSGSVVGNATLAMRASNAESCSQSMFLIGYIDNALGLGYNPQL